MTGALTEWQTQIALKSYQNGLDLADIATILGRSLHTVKEALELAGVEKHTQRPERRVLNVEYRAGYDAGYRSALYHMLLHGWGAAHEYSHHVLLPWQLDGDGHVPPAFPRMYGKHD